MDLSSFLMLLSLEKDLSPEQLATIKLTSSPNNASTLEDGSVNFFLAHILIKVSMRQGIRLLFCKPLALFLSHVQMKMQKFIDKFRVDIFWIRFF